MRMALLVLLLLVWAVPSWGAGVTVIDSEADEVCGLAYQRGGPLSHVSGPWYTRGLNVAKALQ